MRGLVSRVAVLAAATTGSSWAQTTPANPTAATQTVAASTAKRAPVPFGAGERLQYEVRFGSIRVGNANMEVVGLDNVRGRPAWHTAFWVRGGNFLYRVNDVYESWIDAESLSSLRFVQELEEGGKETVRRFEIYPSARIRSDFQTAGEGREIRQYAARRWLVPVFHPDDSPRGRPDLRLQSLFPPRPQSGTDSGAQEGARKGPGGNIQRDRDPAGHQDEGNILRERTRRDLALR